MRRLLSSAVSSSSSSAPSADIARLSEELGKQAAVIQKQQDLLKQLSLAVNLCPPPVAAAAPQAVKPPPKIKSPRGFLDFERKVESYRAPSERIRDWKEINVVKHSEPEFSTELKRQAARCMDCGTPYCQTQTYGCPLSNLIPEWNELVLTNRWDDAIERLHSTNNFPEFTGRVCPAPCEGGCVAGLKGDPVTIKSVEYRIVERAFENGLIQPRIPPHRSGKRVAVVGSGPAGLAAADTLNQLGHLVTVFERADKVGGLLQYGIPTMKLSKDTVQRRVNLLQQEGVVFQTNQEITSRDQLSGFDATCLCIGACKPRDLTVPGRELKGIYFAMDFLTRNQKDLKPDSEGNLKSCWTEELINVRGKNVVVIGGGDTGTDCIGTSIRQFCKSVVNLEVAPQPPASRDQEVNPWPHYPKIFRTDYGHAEAQYLSGGRDPRLFSVTTARFLGDEHGHVKSLVIKSNGVDQEIPCDVVVLAMGFLGVEDAFQSSFKVSTDARGNLVTTGYKALDNVFAAGDCRRGQSLVVWGIREGREAAKKIDQFLQ
ncbi:hypothetical protein BASA81_001126 [Batrachochytrium salamandrivorans]|nr:hypothetical protein BASA81_001126 [Batrachochytrium salamandrivorans]